MQNLMYDLADALTMDLQTKDGKVRGPTKKRRIAVTNSHFAEYNVEVIGGTHDLMKGSVVLKVAGGLHMLLFGMKDNRGDSVMIFIVLKGTTEEVEAYHQELLKADKADFIAEMLKRDQCAAAFQTQWHNKAIGWEKVK